MPLCDGRPETPCPDKRNDNSVKLSQGDLMLCPACDTYRFPPRNSNPTALKSVTLPLPQAADVLENASECNSEKRTLMANELLFFVANTYDKHPLDTIKAVINDFFREDEIISAKQKLVQVLPADAKGRPIQSYTKNRVGSNKLKHLLKISYTCSRFLMKVVCVMNCLRFVRKICHESLQFQMKCLTCH